MSNFCKNFLCFASTLLLLSGILMPPAALALSKADRQAIQYRAELYSEDCVAGPGGNLEPLKGSDNEQKAFNFFIGQGLSAPQSAGIVGNLLAESGGNIDPTLQEIGKPHGALNSPLDGTGYGIAQWTFKDRQQPLVAYAQSHNLEVSSLEAQLGFYWQELSTNKKAVLDELKKINNAADASFLIMDKFEIPGDKVKQKPIRATNANDVLRLYGGGLVISGSNSGSCGASINTSGGTGDLVFPIQASVVDQANWTEDQGVDIATVGGACGPDAPLVAIADAKIVKIGMSGFGEWTPVMQITSGALKDRYVYYGHSKPNKVNVGDTVKAGDVIADVGCGKVGISTGPHLEIGIWPKGKTPSDRLPMLQTSAEMLKILKEAYSNGHK